MISIQEYIKCYENVISTELCEKIINQKDLKFFPATVDDGKIDKHRNCLIKKLLYLGSKNGEYKEHVDHMDVNPRVLSCSLILNDNYDGGDFSFFNKEYIIKKKKGSAIVFPSNFCFPHAVLPITKGDRHSIVTWIC